MMVFFRTRLVKILIWQKFLQTWESNFTAVMKYLDLISSLSKLKRVTCKFTKNRTLSQLFFKEFHCKCRTSILKNASWWLLLRATLFWKYAWTGAFQRQLQSIFILKIRYYKHFTFLTSTSCSRGTNFYGFSLRFQWKV